jgi:ribosomal protein L14E/L6E/L27E
MTRVFQKGVKAIVLKGRRKGSAVEVMEVVDAAFVKIKLAKGKERKMNIKHLVPA